MTNTVKTPHKLLMILLFASLAVMLGAALVGRFTDPHLVMQTPHAAQQQARDDVASVGRLMERVSENPADKDALMALVDQLVRMENWQTAETFVQRAILLDVNDPRPLHLLGVIQHNTGRNSEAAATLEQALKLGDDPSVRYSLGVLCIYYLKDVERGVAHLKAGLLLPSASESLKQHMRTELEKIASAGQSK